jgi:hypothetical protein
MNDRLVENFKPAMGTLAAWLGTLTAWQAHVEWFLKVGASAAAIIVSVLTIRSLLRKERKPSE